MKDETRDREIYPPTSMSMFKDSLTDYGLTSAAFIARDCFFIRNGCHFQTDQQIQLLLCSKTRYGEKAEDLSKESPN